MNPRSGVGACSAVEGRTDTTCDLIVEGTQEDTRRVTGSTASSIDVRRTHDGGLELITVGSRGVLDDLVDASMQLCIVTVGDFVDVIDVRPTNQDVSVILEKLVAVCAERYRERGARVCLISCLSPSVLTYQTFGFSLP